MSYFTLCNLHLSPHVCVSNSACATVSEFVLSWVYCLCYFAVCFVFTFLSLSPRQCVWLCVCLYVWLYGIELLFMRVFFPLSDFFFFIMPVCLTVCLCLCIWLCVVVSLCMFFPLCVMSLFHVSMSDCICACWHVWSVCQTACLVAECGYFSLCMYFSFSVLVCLTVLVPVSFTLFGFECMFDYVLLSVVWI